ncbi:MAG: hypothetical protein PHW17_12225, partial [Desulfobacterales bacterium]|nr:hypothetical protein [Desulfobacterales bacterium]
MAASGNQIIGKVVVLYGTVKAVAPDGTVRVLGPNSLVYAGERIITESDGSVSIVLNDPSAGQIDLGRMSDVLLTEDVYAGAEPDEVTDAVAQAEQVEKAVEADEDIELDATAAGGAQGTGTHEIPIFDLDANEVTPDSGAETTGFTYGTVDTLEGITTDELNGVVTLTATESVDEDGAQSITYTAAVDNAPEGSDLVLILALSNGDSVTITIPVGETTGSAEYTYSDPDPYVDPESITASIENATGGGYNDLDTSATAITEITDTIDTTTVSLSAADVNEDAAGVTFTATLSNPGETDVTIVTNLGEIVIAAGETTGTLFVETADPDVYIDPSSITATVSGVTGGNFEAVDFSEATATAQISDTIDTTTVSLSAADVNEDAAGVTFTATLSNPGETDVTIVTNL